MRAFGFEFGLEEEKQENESTESLHGGTCEVQPSEELPSSGSCHLLLRISEMAANCNEMLVTIMPSDVRSLKRLF